MSDEGRFTIIDGDGVRHVTAEEFQDGIAALEAAPPPRIKHTPDELSRPLGCGCLNCQEARARGEVFTADDLGALIEIRELPDAGEL